MSNTRELLEKIQSGNASWSDFSEFLNLESKDLEPFFNLHRILLGEILEMF